MNRMKEIADYLAYWYTHEPILTIEMYDRNTLDEYCMQTMVFELLRDFMHNPIPESFKGGSPALNQWIDAAFRKLMQGIDFGFTQDHQDAVKNLAFNYWIEGIEKLQKSPAAEGRLFKIQRREETRH